MIETLLPKFRAPGPRGAGDVIIIIIDGRAFDGPGQFNNSNSEETFRVELRSLHSGWVEGSCQSR